MSKQPLTYRVHFCWRMPVSAVYEVEVAPGTLVDDIVKQAIAVAEDDAWEKQVDDYEACGPTFVERIEGVDGAPPVEVPKPFREEKGEALPLDLAHRLATASAGIDDLWIDEADADKLRLVLHNLVQAVRQITAMIGAMKDARG
ncbi:MAG: hypothetical protein ACM31O_03640 [Bacteroidota bacterium]